MNSEQDYAVRDFGSCSLKLRKDLVWVPQLSVGQAYYQVEDPLNAKFFRVGTAEYSFVSLLDGNTSIREAVRQTAIALPDVAFSEQEAAIICRWLLDNRLVETKDAGIAPTEAPPIASDAKTAGHWNPLTVRIPLFHPNRLFSALTPYLNWAFSPLAVLGWFLLVAGSAVVVGCHWTRFLDSIDGEFAPLTWILLPICWLVLKLVHELAHGVACRRFGGDVREAGVLLILLVPVTYVDVTSSWRFRSKWQRVITAAAGMYVELFFAAVAVFVWVAVGPGIVSNACCAIVVMASVTTLAFNTNFLMKFDGYYILSDLLEIPNLSSLAQQELSHLAMRLLGRAGPIPAARSSSSLKRWFVIAYGAASLCWKTLVCACLAIAASTMFDGAGIVLAVVAVALWVFVPTRKLVKHLGRWRQGGDADSHAYNIVLLLTATICALFAAIPWPGAAHTAAVVEYSELAVVRTDSAGFVRGIEVLNGQAVQAGQVLAVLENEELQLELNDLRLSVQQSKVKIRSYEHDRKLAARQAEIRQLGSLQQKLLEKTDQYEKLTIRAPVCGRVVGRGLSNLEGVFLDSGATLLAIGRERHKELQIAIPQEDLPRFQDAVQGDLRVRLPGRSSFHCRLVEVTPRATTQCPHEALAATNGGSLAVRAANTTDAPDEDRCELVAPHFVGTLELSPEQSEILRSGQVGTASLLKCDESIGQHLYRLVRRWTIGKWRRASSQGA